MVRVVSVQGAPRRSWLGERAAFLGWRYELSAVLGVAALGVHRFGRGTVGFRALAGKTVRGAVNWVG
jgi:hypothetical protein